MKRKLGWPAYVVGVIVVAGASFGGYKAWFEAPTQGQIEAAMAAKNWARAATLLNRADLSRDDGRNYFNMGVAYKNLGDDELAIKAFMEADDRGYLSSQSRYHVASLYAKAGDTMMAVSWLGDSIDAGALVQKQIDDDPNFAKIKQSQEWRIIAAMIAPTSDDPRHALDFLVGSWSLGRVNSLGNSALTVTRSLEGALNEKWSGSSSGDPVGAYIFDPETETWKYSYIDGFGRFFVANVEIGSHIGFSGPLRYADGTELSLRIEYRKTSAGIDYVLSQSRDDGVTWSEETLRLTATSGQGRTSF